MQLPQKIDHYLKPDSQQFLCCSGKDYQKLLRNHSQKQSIKMFQLILNQMGELSSKAQGLKSIITSALKFMGTDQRIYIKVRDKQVLGFVKVGQKNLFHRDYIFRLPTCVLDIYVHQSCQRSGIGKEVFEKFLREQKKNPDKIAYDRPSQKLISFLKKHYGLVKYIPQNNNFVVFDKYFQKSSNYNISTAIRPKSYAPINTNKVQKKQVSQLQLKFQQLNMKTQEQNTQQNKINKNNIIQANRPQQVSRRQFKNQMLQQNNKINNVPTLNKFNMTMNSANNTIKHKNISSQSFPLAMSYQTSGNPAFRTTSNTYGNYYNKRK